MKILKDLGNNKYEVEILPLDKSKYRECEFGLAHDYVYFKGKDYLKNENNSTSSVSFLTNIQIPIRMFCKLILPKLNEHQYSQPLHLEDRLQYEDDKYYKQYNLDKPRYLKGDKCASYAYDNMVTHYYENSTNMTAVLLQGDRVPNIMTRKFFEEFVKNNIEFK